MLSPAFTYILLLDLWSIKNLNWIIQLDSFFRYIMHIIYIFMYIQLFITYEDDHPEHWSPTFLTPNKLYPDVLLTYIYKQDILFTDAGA